MSSRAFFYECLLFVRKFGDGVQRSFDFESVTIVFVVVLQPIHDCLKIPVFNRSDKLGFGEIIDEEMPFKGRLIRLLRERSIFRPPTVERSAAHTSFSRQSGQWAFSSADRGRAALFGRIFS